jgi:hypothetical protein
MQLCRHTQVYKPPRSHYDSITEVRAAATLQMAREQRVLISPSPHASPSWRMRYGSHARERAHTHTGAHMVYMSHVFKYREGALRKA